MLEPWTSTQVYRYLWCARSKFDYALIIMRNGPNSKHLGYVLISKYVLISDMHLITRKYGILRRCSQRSSFHAGHWSKTLFKVWWKIHRGSWGQLVVHSSRISWRDIEHLWHELKEFIRWEVKPKTKDELVVPGYSTCTSATWTNNSSPRSLNWMVMQPDINKNIVCMHTSITHSHAVNYKFCGIIIIFHTST